MLNDEAEQAQFEARMLDQLRQQLGPHFTEGHSG
jgi:hypothetical protein